MSFEVLSQTEFWVGVRSLISEADCGVEREQVLGVRVVERQLCVQILALALIPELEFCKPPFPCKIRIKIPYQDVLDNVYKIPSSGFGILEYSRCLINVRFLIFLMSLNKNIHTQVRESWNGGKSQLLKWDSYL